MLFFFNILLWKENRGTIKLLLDKRAELLKSGSLLTSLLYILVPKIRTQLFHHHCPSSHSDAFSIPPCANVLSVFFLPTPSQCVLISTTCPINFSTVTHLLSLSLIILCGWFGSTHVLICLSARKAEQITVELTLETPDLFRVSSC